MHHLILLVLLMNGSTQTTNVSPAMESLANAERAFAAKSVESGLREAFLSFFADDGIAFQPDPVVYKEAAMKRPPPKDPKAYTLDWGPVFGDVSSAGDMGYTTGPYSFVDNSGKNPTSYGFYFSVWKKQADGTWKVAMDIGIGTTDSYTGSREFKQAVGISPRQSKDASEKSRSELLEAERHFLKLAQEENLVEAYSKVLSDESRLHREGLQPITDRKNILNSAAKARLQSWEPMFSDVAQSDDLGYTYGKYETTKEGTAPEKGYFGRVWKRNKNGAWGVVADITNPLPAETP